MNEKFIRGKMANKLLCPFMTSCFEWGWEIVLTFILGKVIMTTKLNSEDRNAY